MTFVIEKGVKIPTVRPSKHEKLRETLLEMEVGDSFFCPDGGEYSQPMLCAISSEVRRYAANRRYSVRKFRQEDLSTGYRVWRVV